MQNRNNVLLKDADSLYPEPALDKRKGLNQHIVGADHGCFSGNEICPRLPGLFVVLVVGVQYGKEGRGIYENAHCW